MASRFEFVSFLSDYGRTDEFVGVCHAVMLDIAPELRIVDITHDVPPFDVRAGALALVRAVQYLPEGVVLAVVDPGVGTDRRCIAVEVENGMLVGPDNGLLAPAVAMLGGPRAGRRARERREYQLPAPGPTFAGRDVMAPAAAHLAAGVPLDGARRRRSTPRRWRPGLVPLPNDEDGTGRTGEVLWVDRFGNCQLNVAPEQLRRVGARARATRSRSAWARPGAGRAGSARSPTPSRPSSLLIVDSYGMCALALDRQSAAAAAQAPRRQHRRAGPARRRGQPDVGPMRWGTSLVLVAAAGADPGRRDHPVRLPPRPQLDARPDRPMPNLPIPNLIAVLLVGLVAALSGVLLIANDVVWMAIVTLVLAAVLIASPSPASAPASATSAIASVQSPGVAGDAAPIAAQPPRSKEPQIATRQAAAQQGRQQDRGPAAIADVGGAGWEAACVEVPEDFPVTTTPPAHTTGTPDLVHNTTTRTARCLSGNSHTSWPRTARAIRRSLRAR